MISKRRQILSLSSSRICCKEGEQIDHANCTAPGGCGDILSREKLKFRLSEVVSDGQKVVVEMLLRVEINQV